MKKLDLQKIIREEVKKALTEVVATKDDLDKIGDFIMSSPTFEYASPSKIKSAIKDMNDEWKSVSRNYKSIEEYFEEMEEMGDTQFMESKKPSKKKKSLKEGYAWERGERKFGEPLPTLASIQAAHQAKHTITERTYLMSNPAIKAKVDKIIELLIGIDVDGETMQYILEAVGMDEQMQQQLTPGGIR